MQKKETWKRGENTKTVRNKSWQSIKIPREFSKCQREMGRASANVESKIFQNTNQRHANM